MKITIKNGRVIDPKNKVDRLADLFIAEESICDLGMPPSDFKADIVIDAKNQIVCPGFIDIGCDLGDLRLGYDDSLETELYAAASGGFTSVCLLPKPSYTLETVEIVEKISRKSETSKGAKIRCIGALTKGLEGEILSDMESLKTAGCIGVSNGERPITDTSVLRNALAYASSLDLLVMLDSHDAWLNAQGVMRSGAASILAGLPGIPKSSELIGLSRNLILVQETGVKAHLRNLSVSSSVDLFGRFSETLTTCDVGLMHLLLSDDDIDPFDPSYNVIPPLPSSKDCDLLINCFADGRIDILSSQHKPVVADLKQCTFESSKPGISCFDTFLPLALNLAKRKEVELTKIIDSITRAPAEALGLSEGEISKGSKANICVFDPYIKWTADPLELLSWGKNTPFQGKTLEGKVTNTIIEGNVVYSNKTLTNKR